MILLINAKCINDLVGHNGKFTFKQGHIYPTRLGISSHSFLVLCEERQWINLSRYNHSFISFSHSINPYENYKFMEYDEYFKDANKLYVANKKELSKLVKRYDFKVGRFI